MSISIEELTNAAKDVDNYWAEKMPMMAMEEMGELIQALSKKERNPSLPTDDIEDEIRDVSICIGALMQHYGIDHQIVEQKIAAKLGVVYAGTYEEKSFEEIREEFNQNLIERKGD